jgi:hypothetical protein
MYLSKDEEAILNGEKGEILKKLMNLIVSVGEVMGADHMIKVTSVQVSGISYKNIGEPGLNFLKEIADSNVQAVVPTFINPAGCDLQDYKVQQISEEFFKKQFDVVNQFKRMGIIPTCSCTPYLIGLKPLFGEHISWAESSAVAFANSVIGARTNREGGPAALASALLGKTANYGLHLDENRKPTHRFIIDEKLKFQSDVDWSLLGYSIGREINEGVPFIIANKQPHMTNLKALSAGLAASGAIGLFHLDSVTPEANVEETYLNKLEKTIITNETIKQTQEELSTQGDKMDFICIGCPHSSIDEIYYIEKLTKSKQLIEGNRFWICTSRYTKTQADEGGITERLNSRGILIVADTCPVVAPLSETEIKGMITNSSKAAHYMPKTNNIPTKIIPIEDIVNEFFE